MKKTLEIDGKKYCNQCQQFKLMTIDNFNISKNRLRMPCLECCKINRNLLKNENSINNKKYRNKNKEKLAKYRYMYEKKRHKTDGVFKLKKRVSSYIRMTIKNNLGTKKNKSAWAFLPYNSEQLRHHLELQFESWMTWENNNKYFIDTWNDDEPSTWTWQIDHIIPQSDLPYSSMNDENFQKCWALKNLRPYSAKQNLLDGVRRIRHKIKEIL